MHKRIILFLLLGLINTCCLAQKVSDQHLYNIIVEKPEDDSTHIHFEIVIEDSENEEGGTFRTDSIDEFIQSLLQDVSSLPDEKNNILIYIHGMFGSNRWTYNHVLGMLYKAFIHPEVSDISRILSVKWPGNNVEYKDNKARVPLIADELNKILLEIVRQVQLVDIFNPFFSTEFDLIAHSLGNELFKEVITRIDGGQLQYPLFDQVVLAAPDLDVDVFDKSGPLTNLKFLAQGTHLYFSRRDITLGVSRNLNKKDRLGIIGPVDSTTYWDSLMFIDVSQIKDEPNFGERLSGHSYYRSSATATKDILCAFLGTESQCNSERIPGDQSRNIYMLEH